MRVLLNKRPVGEPRDDDFRIETVPVAEPGEGELLLKVLWLSLDPYMRGRMNDVKSYAPPVGLGEVMVGETVNQVIISKSPHYTVGDIVVGGVGWQQYAVVPGDSKEIRKVDPELGPISTALYVLGMTGRTAYFGLLQVGEPKPGETVVVAAASGAVGSVVGQIAKIKGCRAVGIAGGKEKCDYVKNELGFDAVIDRKGGNMAADLKAACPDGIDVYFENVGGEVLHAVTPLLNPGARVPICGFVSQYNKEVPSEMEAPHNVLAKLPNPPFHRFLLVREWIREWAAATAQLSAWVKAGKLKYRESVVDGLDNAPATFRGLLQGKNFGKQLIRVADPD
ncbi:NADP-dependent oxidoreductase [bacterium]|nr:NADP-dependent oxidoreductase [bacterium]